MRANLLIVLGFVACALWFTGEVVGQPKSKGPGGGKKGPGIGGGGPKAGPKIGGGTPKIGGGDKGTPKLPGKELPKLPTDKLGQGASGNSPRLDPGFAPRNKGAKTSPFSSYLPQDPKQRSEQRNKQGDKLRSDWAKGPANASWNHFKDSVGDPGWAKEYPQAAQAYYHQKYPHADAWFAAASASTLTGWWAKGYGEPVYYDYGAGGNVYYQENSYYVNGEQVSAEEYASQAEQTAAAGAEQLAQPLADDEKEQWLPLGIFALTTGESVPPTRLMQLAVNKRGVINGTMLNLESKSLLPIFGSVERKTQRACWYVGDKTDIVFETGVYNLTKPQSSVLVHFGKDGAEEYLFVRITPTEGSSGKKQLP